MSAQELEKRKGCNQRVLWFFIFAVACVAAFLIIGLVKTCKADHEDKEEEKLIEQQEIVMASQSSLDYFA